MDQEVLDATLENFYSHFKVLRNDYNIPEEHIVNTISNGLTTVFVDNPWLTDYIKKYTPHKNNNENTKIHQSKI